jgi:hypothetical protein
MALDEHRKPFNTTMWHYPGDAEIKKPEFSISELRARWEKVRDTHGAKEQTLAQAWSKLVDAQMFEELKGAESELLQVWFPGYHINIGGGSDDLLKNREGDFERTHTGLKISEWIQQLTADNRNFYDHFSMDGGATPTAPSFRTQHHRPLGPGPLPDHASCCRAAA